MIFDKELYWARRRNKSEVTLKSGRKVLIDKPLRGQGDEVRRGKLIPSVDNRAERRRDMKFNGGFKKVRRITV